MSLKIKPESLVTIMGRRGSGKTTLAKALLKVWPTSRVFIFDPMNEYSMEHFFDVYTLEQACDALIQGHPRVRLGSPSPEEGAEMFDFLREIDNILMVYDEADMVLKNQHNPEAFGWIVNYGRHVGQGMILIARRPQALPRNFTAQSILFFTDTLEPRDQQYLKDRLGCTPCPVGEYCWVSHNFDGEIQHFPRTWAPSVLGIGYRPTELEPQEADYAVQ